MKWSRQNASAIEPSCNKSYPKSPPSRITNLSALSIVGLAVSWRVLLPRKGENKKGPMHPEAFPPCDVIHDDPLLRWHLTRKMMTRLCHLNRHRLTPRNQVVPMKIISVLLILGGSIFPLLIRRRNEMMPVIDRGHKPNHMDDHKNDAN